METLFLRIVNIAIKASWLVLAVLLLRLLLKKAPKWATCLLWGIVALRLILPFSLESALSLIPNTEPILQESIVTQAPNAAPTLPDQIPSVTPGVNQTPDRFDQTVTPPASGSLAPTPTASVDPWQVALFAASIVWLCGILAMLAYSAFSYLRLRRSVRVSLLKEGRVYLCDSIDTPFILGVFRPRIYLPSGIAESEIPYVIAHEEAHLKRKDHLWKPLGFLLLAVYWFNPLLWVAYILLCRDIENACDEKVIKNCDNAYRVGYSEALLSCSIHRRSVMACPVAFGETGVKSRIRAVLHYKKPAFWVILLAIVAIIVTCVCFLTDPVSAEGEITTAVTTEDTPVTTGKTPVSTTAPTTTLSTATTAPTTAPPTTTSAPMTETPTPPENPDAWMEKVEWGNDLSDAMYDEATGKYDIGIFIQDIHGVGEANAYHAFSEQYGLPYVSIIDGWGIPALATMEEIAFYAKLDEVKLIQFHRYTQSDDPLPDESAWWQQIAVIHGITHSKDAAGKSHYTWGLTIRRDGGFFPTYPENYADDPTLAGVDSFSLTRQEGAYVYIKDVSQDGGYTEYMIKSWRIEGDTVWFEVNGFIPEQGAKYDMGLFFILPKGSSHPGELCYAWALGKTWTLK